MVPWLHGTAIRGGTPAILVRGVYLLFFHIKSADPSTDALKPSSYKMGALTFCPAAPFRIQAVSPEPIIHKDLYGGSWLTRSITTVVFPAGLVLYPDGENLLLSFGWQDRHSVIAKLNIQGLFESLITIADCT